MQSIASTLATHGHLALTWARLGHIYSHLGTQRGDRDSVRAIHNAAIEARWIETRRVAALGYIHGSNGGTLGAHGSGDQVKDKSLNYRG